MIKRISQSAIMLLVIALPVCSFGADEELEWGLLGKKYMKKEEIEKFATKGEVILPELKEAFKSENINKKVNVMNILGYMKGENSKKEMIDILKTLCVQPLSGRKWEGLPEEIYLEEATLISIGKSGKEAHAILNENLNGAKGELRKCLIIGTGYLKDNTYYDNIVDILETDKNPYLRYFSAFALAKIGNEKAMPLLEKVYLNDEFYSNVDESFSQQRWAIKDGKYYPVKEAAMISLFFLGKTLEQRGIISPKGVELPSPGIANKPYYTPPPGLTNKPTPPGQEKKQ